jgi:phosphinothricin acetyltransferase
LLIFLKDKYRMIIRQFDKHDFAAVKEIYQQGIDTREATFENMAPNWEIWDVKFSKDCRIVAMEGDAIVGWAALSAASSRAVYVGVCEVSVYVRDDKRGKGIGKKLLLELINLSEENNVWTLQASIFPENLASRKLHAYAGFREVGFREKIGKMDDLWRNTILVERRSRTIL